MENPLWCGDEFVVANDPPYYRAVLYGCKNHLKLPGARKYKLGITLAHQTTSDIPSKLLSSIVGNVGTVISLQIAAGDAPFFARELQIRKDGNGSYSPETLQNLTTGFGYVRTPSYSSGIHIAVPSTPVVSLAHPLPTDELKRASKQNFGIMPKTEPDELEAEDIRVFRRDPAPEMEPEDALAPETPAEAVDTATPVVLEIAEEHVAEASAPERKRPATPRRPQRSVVRKTIKKKSLIPEESIEIE